jgi:hypothetical protein
MSTPEAAVPVAAAAAAAAATTKNDDTPPPPPSQHGSTESPDSSNDKNLIQFWTGIKSDFDARWPLYADDWRVDNYLTVFNATIYAFVIQLIPALIFAELMDRETEGNLATAEVLLSSGIMGVIYAVFAGQPLVIMGITGPVAVLLGTSYSLTETFDAEYFPFFFWICVWAGILHIISALIGLVTLVWSVTPFTSQIFELFIAITFLYAAVRDLVEPLYLGQPRNQEDRGSQYATLLLGILTFFIAWTLHFAETWVFFTRHMRTFLTSYNTAIACVVVTAISFLPGVDQENNGVGGLDRVNIRFTPWDWQPTADRKWLVDPFDGIDAKGIFAAMIPGFMFFLLFIIDHNVSSILTQSPKFNLKKPSAYHLDFFVLGLTFFPCAILGLPPGNGLIPQAPLHCRALCTREFETDQYGVKREVVTHCEEQRWSALGQALLMFVALACFIVLSWIPRGCLFGLLFYLGMGALDGNEIWERFTFCFILPKRRPQIPVVREVKWRTVQLFTAVQFACAFLIFAVAQFAEIGYIYPAMLTALVPFRAYILSRVFSEHDMKYLDPFGESEEEYEQEQKLVREAERHVVEAEEDVEFPNFGSFRAGGLRQRLHQRRHTLGKDQGIVPEHMDLESYVAEKHTDDHMVGILEASKTAKKAYSRSNSLEAEATANSNPLSC